MSERADDTNHQPVKLLLSFDPLPDRREDYVQYVLGEFVPSLARAGLPMCEAWHTAYGRYPLRLTGFLAPISRPLSTSSVPRASMLWKPGSRNMWRTTRDVLSPSAVASSSDTGRTPSPSLARFLIRVSGPHTRA